MPLLVDRLGKVMELNGVIADDVKKEPNDDGSVLKVTATVTFNVPDRTGAITSTRDEYFTFDVVRITGSS